MLDFEQSAAADTNQTPFNYRPATFDDYDALDGLFYELLAQHASSVPEVYFLHEPPAYSRDYVSQLIGGTDSDILVAERATEVVGLAQLSLHNFVQRGPRAARRYVLVESFIVADHVRRLGVGRGLMQAVEAWAHQRKAQHIELTVWEFNQGAIDFYETLGYSTLRRRMWLHLDEEQSDPELESKQWPDEDYSIVDYDLFDE